MLLRPDQRDTLEAKFRALLPVRLWDTLERELITEVMLNDDDRVFVERSGVGIEDAGVRMGHAARAALVKTAATLGEERPREGYPIIEAALPPPLRWRFSAFLPPITSAAVVTIRIPSERVFRLESYLRHDQISIGQFEALQDALCGPAPSNIVVAGGTGAGKTAFTCACLQEVATAAPKTRIFVLEKTRELRCDHAENLTMVQTKPDVDMQALVEGTLRMRPDRIVVGEVRGVEARQLIEAWNTGHTGGLTTIHADDARAALRRLELLCSDRELTLETRAVWREHIAASVKMVVHMAKRTDEGGRFVNQLVKVSGLDEQGDYQCELIE